MIFIRSYLSGGMETVLATARMHLLRHKEDPFYSGETGIEVSLIGEFLVQMIELNKFMYTTCSTNHPYDLIFQEMFVGGFVERLKITDQFLTEMRNRGLSYYIKNFNTKEVTRHISPGALKIMLEYEKLSPTRIQRFEQELGYRYHPLSMITVEPDRCWRPELSEITKPVDDEILSGEIVELFVVNFNDPLDRSLYKILTQLFQL